MCIRYESWYINLIQINNGSRQEGRLLKDENQKIKIEWSSLNLMKILD